MRTLFWTLVGLVVVLLVGAFFVVGNPFAGTPSQKNPDDTFGSESIVVIEDGLDYPDEPRAVHPGRVHVIDLATQEATHMFDLPTVGRNRPVALLSDALFYFDLERLGLVEATTDTLLPGTEVLEGRFGGYAAATERDGSPVVAYGRTRQVDSAFRAELVVATKGDGWTSKTVWQSTGDAALVAVPLAWATDGETIFFGVRPVESANDAPFASLMQLKVPRAGDSGITAEASNVAFPADDTALLGVSEDSNLAVFVESTQQAEPSDETTPHPPTVFLVNLESGETQSTIIPDAADITSVGFGDETAVLTGLDEDGEGLWLVQFGVSDATHQNLNGSGAVVCSVEGSAAIIGFNGTQRGTWRVPLAGTGDSARISQFVCTRSVSMPRSNP